VPSDTPTSNHAPQVTPSGGPRGRVFVSMECADAADAAGRIARLLLPNAVERAIAADIEACLAQGAPISARCAYRSSGGQDVTVAYTVSAVRAEASAGAKGIRVVIAEEPAGSTEETPLALLVALLDNADSPVYVKDVYGRYLYANRALADLYGLPAERLIGAADADLFDPAVARSLWEAEQRVLESEAPLTVEETLPGARPGQVYVSHRFALLDREGQPTAIASISTDIAGQPRADSPLGRSAERILALNDCFLSFGPDPEENMRRLTTLSNTLLGGSCATYQRAGRGLISSLGLWCAAANAVVDAPSGSSGLICTDLLARDDETVHVLRNLQSSPYARTDPNVAQFGLQTCVGRTVRLGGRVLGALCVLYREDYAPSDEDGRLLGIVASALAVEERRLRAEQRQAVSYGIADAASKSAGLHDLGCFIHQELRRLIEARNFYLAIDDRENRQIVFPYYVDENIPGGIGRPARPYANGLTELVISTGQALLLYENDIRSRVRAGHLQIIGALPRVWVGVPLSESGETVGMMAVQSYSCAEAYDREDLEFLEFVSGQVASAIKAKRASDALAESEQRYRAVAENVSDIIWARDMALRPTYVSASVRRVLGYTVEEALGQSLEEAYTPESARALRALIDRVAAADPSDERDDETLEVECYRKDGATIWAEVTLTFLRNGDGRPIRILGVTRDITQRRELERQLRQVNKLESLGQLAGGIAHHFNNLLTVINGYSQFMLTSLEDGDPVRRDAESILKAGRRAAELTRQLLDFSRRRVMNPDVVNLNILLVKTADMLRSVIGDDIYLHLELAEGLPSVRVDQGQIEQVVLNLAVNSRDAMPEGGNLTLATAVVGPEALPEATLARDAQGETTGRYVRLTVADTGMGMPPEVREHLFEPFFTTKEVGEGTGLGLATVYGIVTQAGGQIDVDTEVGRGTRVHVYLPAVDAAPAPEAAPPTSEATPRGKEHILVLEDEPDVRDLAVRMLERLGYRVLPAASGAEGLQAARASKRRIDLVLADVMLPEMRGEEFVRRLRAEQPHIKVLYMSGYSDGSALSRDVEESGAPFIGKPFTLFRLAQKVRHVLDAE